MGLNLDGLGVQITKPEAMLSQASMVFYGLPGSGKTTLAASAVEVAELSPVLVLDFENSSAAVAAKYGDHPNLDVIQLRTWAQSVKTIDAVLQQDHGYKTVIVDPVNGLLQMCQIAMRDQVRRKIELLSKPKPTPKESAQLKALSRVKVPDAANNSMGDVGTTEADYGVIGNEAISLMARMNAAPFLVIMNTHADEYSSRTQTREILRPDMPGKVGRRVMTQKPHVVGFMDIVDGKDGDGKPVTAHRIQFKAGKVGSLPFEAKSRLGLEKPFINPTMPILWDAMNNQHVK